MPEASKGEHAEARRASLFGGISGRASAHLWDRLCPHKAGVHSRAVGPPVHELHLVVEVEANWAVVDRLGSEGCLPPKWQVIIDG